MTQGQLHSCVADIVYISWALTVFEPPSCYCSIQVPKRKHNMYYSFKHNTFLKFEKFQSQYETRDTTLYATPDNKKHRPETSHPGSYYKSFLSRLGLRPRSHNFPSLSKSQDYLKEKCSVVIIILQTILCVLQKPVSFI